ncbi:MAG TPA: YibE/F family protein, partial [Anaerolineales bacterium]|nr:YibE/F family protein [Anaerolineales bacterium]
QSSVVVEILGADRTLTMRGLFWKGMRVGQDHVAATVNTLVLAYTGAALPMLLLFSLSGEAFENLVNLEFIAVEIVRTLVGSLGLIAAVPITTGLASALALTGTPGKPVRVSGARGGRAGPLPLRCRCRSEGESKQGILEPGRRLLRSPSIIL